VKMYVSNVSFDVSSEELQTEFGAFGKVASVTLVTDKYDGRPRGFGFVEMPSMMEGQLAMARLNGKNMKGRALVVSARPRTDGRSGGYRTQKGST
jgi:cold-inducible RNA-binding protein